MANWKVNGSINVVSSVYMHIYTLYINCAPVLLYYAPGLMNETRRKLPSIRMTNIYDTFFL